ncbi:MAG: hypothetical protein HYZ81_25875, partial [Nitrospinae bacterium]|nr:hypothetical protein [Nitrospinota bacterium]
AVPDTIQGVIMARIDRLPPEDKRLLQAASVVGMEVSFGLLKAIAAVPEERLDVGLTHLQRAELLYETRLSPEITYTFKHALTCQVAYDSLLQGRRHALHARIVEAIETLYADRLADQVERLAYHALKGEVWGKALTYCRQTGAKACAHSAYQGAVARFEQALVALQHLPDKPDTREQGIDLRFDLRNALLALGEHSRILEHLRQAETLAEALNDQRRLGQISAYLTEYFRQTGEPDRAVECGQRALSLATALGDFPLQVLANYFLGTAYHDLGDYRRALDCLRQNVASLAGDRLHDHFGLPGLASVLCRARLVSCAAEMGAFAEGTARSEEAVRIAESVDHLFSRTMAYFGVGDLSLRQGDLPKAISMLERGLQLCRVANIHTWSPTVGAALGYAYALSGRVAEGLSLLQQAVEQAASMGISAIQSRRLAYLSEAYLLAGHLDEATDLAGRALALARDLKARGYEAYALCCVGEIHLHQDPSEIDAAEAAYRQALTLADELGMRPLLAHCHLGFAALYRLMGRLEQAHAELSKAIELFHAMHMTFWLSRAEAGVVQA